MRLDVTALRYLSKDDLRVLTAVEMGMRNHEMVPLTLITSISGLRFGGADKALRELHKHKLVHHEQRGYDGYRLTNLGYDFLALSALSKRGSVVRVGNRLGVGKEADVFHGENEDGQIVCLKIHRLGRTSFRAVKDKRDYLRHRHSTSWLYLSRLAATREYAFMKALHAHKFPVPEPIDCSRHIVVMGLVDGYPLTQVKELGSPSVVCNQLLDVAVRLAEVGLVHCDLNEFNVLVDDDEKVTVIDFPQMVSTSHADAPMLFQRDVESLYKFFRHRFGLDEEIHLVDYQTIERQEDALDIGLEASGFGHEQEEEFEEALDAYRVRPSGYEDEDEEDAESDEQEQEDGEQQVDSAQKSNEHGEEQQEEREQADSSYQKLENEKGCTLRGEAGTGQGIAAAATESIAERDFTSIVPEDQQVSDENSVISVAGLRRAPSTRMSRATVAEKVRKQREKQTRRTANRRNVSKSEAKKKAKSALASASFWGED